MILLIDIGNTRVKWGMLEQGTLNVSEDTFPVMEISIGLGESFARIKNPTRVFISNVAGKETGTETEEWITKTWQVTPDFVVSRSEYLGIQNAYAKPGQLGVDRWLAMIGAFQYFPDMDNSPKKESCDDISSLCIIDCGSAVTIDVLTGDGKHQGGLIVPGLHMMRDGLMEKIQINANAGTEKTENTISLLARDTQSAISGGTLYTLVAAIDRITTDLRAEMEGSLICIITGGDAKDLLPLLSGEYIFRPNLVLEGLAVIANAG